MMQKRLGDLLQNVTKGFIIHGCNAQGVMGSGFAKQLKETYPEAYAAYRKQAMSAGLSLGDVVTVPISDDLVIFNAITQDAYYGHPNATKGQTRFTDYEAMARVMENANYVARTQYSSIEQVLHFPLIGAYRGGGDWEIIKTIIERSAPDLEKNLWVLD
jgi:O-acetyl-ADP-ribose deacetylase (regulator of RNase III)